MCKPWSRKWRTEQLQLLREEWAGCQRCPYLEKVRHQVVMGHGNPEADIMFIGQAPGEMEDEKGKPFVGPSGKFLDNIFQALRYPKRELFMTNIVACWPPEDREPTTDEKKFCRERLLREIYIVDPKIIVVVGRIAMQALLKGKETSIERERGKMKTVYLPGRKFQLRYDCVPIFHPSYILRNERPNKQGKYKDDSDAMRTFRDIEHVFTIVEHLNGIYSRYEESF
jgi:uracil-DNA glycosylase family 4